MTGGRSGTIRGDVLRLFEGETVAGLADGDLLERFATRRDEAAFEALVSRLGPMVLGVCRRMLHDPHDVDDAFQATFLVLVRRAGSIREPDLVGPWLHGVAAKVARRARAETARRLARERPGNAVAEAHEVEIDLDRSEIRARIDEEIDRLPEHHRRPVVLCDVEGLSREEAALRLGWSLNMVRGRLARARDRLRDRLARRGMAPSGAWMALAASPSTPSPALVATTSRAALAFAVGRVGSILATAEAVALSRGVLRMMMLSKMKIAVIVALSAGLVAAGSGMLAAQGPGDKTVPAPGPAQTKPAPAPAAPASDIASLAQKRIEMARIRLKTQQTFYNNGQLTTDRLLNASQTLMDAEMDAIDTPKGRLDAIRAHLERITEMEKREITELAEGRATTGDVAEIQTQRMDTEFRLAKETAAAERQAARVDPPTVPRPAKDQVAELEHIMTQEAIAKLVRDRVVVARRIFENAQKLYPGEISIFDMLDAALILKEAERDAAESRDARVTAIQGYVDLLKRSVAAKTVQVEKNEATRSDVDRLRLKVLDAEIALAREKDGSGTDSVADLDRRVSEMERKLDRLLNLLNDLKR